MTASSPGPYAVPGAVWPGAVWPGDPVASPGPAVAQMAGGSATGLYGFGTTAISTARGSFLVAFIGWNTSTAGVLVPAPAVSVTDSAGNLWQQAGISAPGAGLVSAVRSAVWVAPNARPVSWVSVGLTGFAQSAAWLIAEITGMPQAAVMDFCVSQNAAGTGPSLSWVASGADIGFTVVAAGNSGETVTAAPGGWTALTPVTAGSGVTGTAIFPYWNNAVGAGSATTAFTMGTSASYAFTLSALSATASPPPQPSQNFPLVIVEAAFGAQPGNISASTDFLFSSEYITWSDITARVIGPAVQGRISCARGRQYQLQQEETGQATIPLSNQDGAFTPTNPGSPWYSNALNSNMSFAAGIAGWSPGAGGVSIAPSAAQLLATGLNAVSRGSMLVTPNAGASGAVAAKVPVNPNYPYSGSAWFYSPGGWASGGHIQVNWSTASGTFISTSTGSAVALTAGQWMFVSFLNITPPAGAGQASLIVSLAGSPTSANPFYVAEAAIVAGPQAVQTGLILPVTPIRVTAWWQGRREPVWAGYAQQWPQEWPQLPQWGFAALKAADALAVAAAGQMQSALIGEVLIDNPYAYLPCNESYTSAVNGATPSNPFIVTGGFLQPADADGLIAVNRAAGNQVTGTYFDGTSQPVSTGLAMNFLGDDGTGMGATGYSGQVTGERGPSMLYEDPGLPAVASTTNANGFTVEYWFVWNNPDTMSGNLLAAFGPASTFFVPGTQDNGASLVVEVIETSPTTAPQILIVTAAASIAVTLTQSQNPQHLVIEFSGGGSPTVSGWLNGASMGAAQSTSAITLNAIVLGPGRYAYDCGTFLTNAYRAGNFAAGHLAVYPYQLSPGRITAHYQAGFNGWSGVGAGTRFSQILTWAQLGLKRGGYSAAGATGTPEVTRIGPAYDLAGQQANGAVFALSKSEGGDYGTQANGSLVYLERDAGYNLPVSAVLSDGTAAAPVVLNTDPGFATGLAGWTASGGTVTYSPASRYGLVGSLQVSTAGTAKVTSPAFTWNGGSASAGFWVQPTASATVTCTAAASGGTATTTVPAPGSAWTFVSLPVPAVPAAASAALSASAGTVPFLLAWAGLWYSPGQVPYLPQQSYGFDQTYLYNEVTAAQQSGPSQLVLVDSRGTASQQQYGRRSALSFTPNVVSAYDVSDVTTWSLAQFQQPSMHVSRITIDAASNPLGAFRTVLELDQGQVALTARNPVGGAPLAETGTVQRVQHDIGAGYWRTSYQLSPYGPAQAALCVDTPGFNSPATAGLAW